jgi:hypothetical protein
MNARMLTKALLHVVLPLLIGLLIYLFYRPNVWIAPQFGFKELPYSEISTYSIFKKWVIFSGPDLCWAYSFASAIFILNHLFKYSSHSFVLILVLIIVGASELIQLFLQPDFNYSCLLPVSSSK